MAGVDNRARLDASRLRHVRRLYIPVLCQCTSVQRSDRLSDPPHIP